MACTGMVHMGKSVLDYGDAGNLEGTNGTLGTSKGTRANGKLAASRPEKERQTRAGPPGWWALTGVLYIPNFAFIFNERLCALVRIEGELL